MPYLDTNAKTTKVTSNEAGKPLGRLELKTGVYSGFVKDTKDVQLNGRLRVWIPEFGSAPDEEPGWITVNYCSPFAGATNIETSSKTNFAQFDGTQTSYGMWMVPPDINNHVIVMFINGDTSKGIWIGSMYNQFMNNMVPGMAASENNHQYPGEEIPVAEYNKWDQQTTQPDRATKPYEETKFKGLGNQGLIKDKVRGTTKTSARRESPSAVFGILTPGPVIDKSAAPSSIRRKGGSSFIMDDGENSEYIELETKSGAQVHIDETNGFIYMINRDGTAWVQMDQAGNIDIFGATNISMRAQRDINIRADRNVNIEAGQNVFIKAAKDTKQGTTDFTYDVNNLPKPTTIPVWSYVGEGNGDGGDIVMQSLNNLQSTSTSGAFITTINDNVNIKAGNTFNLQTITGGQNFNSKQGIKMTTDAAFDLGATGNIRVGSKGIISVVGIGGINVCSENGVGISSDVSITGTTELGSSLTVNTSINAASGSFAGSVFGFFEGTDSGPGAGITGSAGPAVSVPAAQGAITAAPATPAQIKPLVDKVNILATWANSETKFKRNSESLQTTVSRLPTYEPCPEHENFIPSNVSNTAPALTPDDKTYEGSSGAGNNASVAPAAAVNPAADSVYNSSVSIKDSDVSKDINTKALRYQLIYHEGYVNKSYVDTTNLLHGGIGHLMRNNEIPLYPVGTPISESQIDTWYMQDSTSAIKIAQTLVGSSWSDLSDVRKRALTDLAYNLGQNRLGKFSLFLAAMKNKDYNTASRELRNSIWFNQVGKRGPNIVTMIAQNVDPTGSDRKA
jgi:lysozyme